MARLRKPGPRVPIHPHASECKLPGASGTHSPSQQARASASRVHLFLAGDALRRLLGAVDLSPSSYLRAYLAKAHIGKMLRYCV